MHIFVREVVSKLVPVLRVDDFKAFSTDCSILANGSSELSATSPNPDPTPFETRLFESAASSPLLQIYKNTTYMLEYYLKIMVFGRDGNNLPLPIDESPVLTELAMIDNSAFSVASNITLKAPRRFFRIGVAQVILFILKIHFFKLKTP